MLFHSLVVAYIDPSAGGMRVQLLLAGTAGVAVLGNLFWTQIKATLGFKSKTPPESNGHDQPRGQ